MKKIKAIILFSGALQAMQEDSMTQDQVEFPATPCNSPTKTPDETLKRKKKSRCCYPLFKILACCR